MNQKDYTYLDIYAMHLILSKLIYHILVVV